MAEDKKAKSQLPQDDYAAVLPDIARSVAGSLDSYQEEDPPRNLKIISVFCDSNSGIICSTDDRGIPQIMATDFDDGKRQRFFMGGQVEAGTKDWVFQTTNLLTDPHRGPKAFGIINACNELLEISLKEAQQAGDKVQRKIDDENYEWYPIFLQPGKVYTINSDKEIEPDLTLIKKLVILARSYIISKLGSKIDKISVSIVKWAEHRLYVDNLGAQGDQIIPRAGISISVKSKEGNEVFGTIHGAMGTLEEILMRYSELTEKLEDVIKKLADRVVKEVIDLDRAQGTFVLNLDSPVILSSSVAGVFAHEVCGHPAEGDIIVDNRRQKNAKLVLKSRIGAQVSGNSNFNLIDTPASELQLGEKTIRYNFGSFVVDGHGTEAKPVQIVENGVLVGILTDRYCFNEVKDGLKEDLTKRMEQNGLSGSARREKYDDPPQVRMRNTIILPDENGPNSLEEMAALLPPNKKGLYVDTCRGGWVNPDTGEFQIIGGRCFLIENSQVVWTKPIKNIKINGNISKIIIKSIGSSKTIGETFTGYCGKDNQWVPVDGCGPNIWIENVTTAGGSLRTWSEILKDYLTQRTEVVEGKRSADSVYLSEVSEVIGEGRSQANVCLVTAYLSPKEEATLIMGLRDKAHYEPDEKTGKLKRRRNIYE